MLDDKPVPSLSSDGWVTSTPMKADYLISHFFLSEYSRTYLYKGHIASFPWLLQNHKNDLSALKRAVEQTLKDYFGSYFPSATVEVTTKNEEGSKYAIIIYVSVTDVDGKEFSIGRLAQVVDAKIVRIQQINNYGVDPNE